MQSKESNGLSPALVRSVHFIIEDERDWRSKIRGLLEDEGHLVVGEATSKHEALSAISKFGELGVQIATLDANLDDPTDTSGKDGQEILAAIRAGAPKVKTICIAFKPFPGADKDLRKSNMDNFAEVVKGL